jgi:hypothetical protein
MTFAEWLDYYCINRSKLADLLDTTRQSVAGWTASGVPEQHRKTLEFVWGELPDEIFIEATRTDAGKLIKRGEEMVWLD